MERILRFGQGEVKKIDGPAGAKGALGESKGAEEGRIEPIRAKRKRAGGHSRSLAP